MMLRVHTESLTINRLLIEILKEEGMRHTKLILVILITIFLVGCIRSTANYEKLLETWVGQPASKLIRSWGRPTNTTDLSGSVSVYNYVEKKRVWISGYTYNKHVSTTYHNRGYRSTVHQNYVPTRVRGYSVTRHCITSFVARRGIITKWSWKGNNCRALPPKRKK